MIRIRYKDLSPGLHGTAVRRAHRTTVYLLPGLTAGQRKAALRRLRQEASRRYGPALPLPELAVALAVDRIRMAFRNTAAVVRLHPAKSAVSAVAAGGLMALFVLASVSVRIVHLPSAVPGSTVAGGTDPAAASRVPAPSDRPGGPGSAPRAPGDSAGGRREDLPGGTGLGSGSHSVAGIGGEADGAGPGLGASAGQEGGAGSGAEGGCTADCGSGPGVPVSATAAASSGTGLSALVSTGPTGLAVGTSAGSGAGRGVSVSVSADPQASPSASLSSGTASGGVAVCVSIGPLGGCLGI